MRYLLPVAVTLALALGSLRSANALASDESGSNVILLTLDGVRWQEVFHGADPSLTSVSTGPLFPFLTGALSKEGVLFGDRGRGDDVAVANSALNSLPGYQSIMSGATQPCRSNACGRITVETLQERLVRELGIPRERVATIASWEKIANAAEHVEGTTFVNAGQDPLKDSDSDDELERLNKEQKEQSPPWGSARFDRYTFAQGLRYLKVHKPRFLHLALNDSDEWGHRNDYKSYLATLQQYDAWIKALVTALDGMGDYGKRTTLIVTTDHGRGDNSDWKEHGSGYPGSRYVWVYVRSPATESGRAPAAAKPSRAYNHLDIRPTIETIFGLRPQGTGKVIEGVAHSSQVSKAT